MVPSGWPTAPRCAGSWATATTGTRGGPDTRLLEVVVDGCGVEHNDVDHNPARNGDADRVVPAEDRSREDRCGHRGSADRVSDSGYRR